MGTCSATPPTSAKAELRRSLKLRKTSGFTETFFAIKTLCNVASLRRLDAQANREPNLGILEHERKRKLEVKCLELEEVLEEQGLNEEEIEEKVGSIDQSKIGLNLLILICQIR